MTIAPAITFDAAAFREWLNDGQGEGLTTVADYMGVDDYFGKPNDDGTVAVLHELLRCLHGDGEYEVPSGIWAPRDDVLAVSMWRTCDGDGVDGGAVLTVKLDSGIRVATRHIAHDEWTTDEATRGVDAAVEAFDQIAGWVNEAVEAFDANR